MSAVIERSLGQGDVFVDIGANIGYDALLASRRVGGTGKVVAIEALPQTFAHLQRNLALNDAQNVRALNVAVADRESIVQFVSFSPPAMMLGRRLSTATPPAAGRRSSIAGG